MPELAVHRYHHLRAAEREAAKAGALTAWEQYAQVLLLSNEFAFVD